MTTASNQRASSWTHSTAVPLLYSLYSSMMKSTSASSMCTLAWWCAMQDGILPFMKSMETDLAKARDRHACNKDPGEMHSYALLVANYGGIMAVPTNPLYCLVYPTVYNNDVEDQNHFNTAASPSGMHTHVCMCRSLLQLVDKDPDNRRNI